MKTDHIDGGAYVTARAIFDNDLWRHPAQHRIFEYIRGRAIFAKEGYTIAGVLVPRGSFLASYRKLAEGTAWIEKNNCLKQYSISTVKSVTDALIAKGRLTKDENAICTIWHVTNYDKYQSWENYGKDFGERTCRTPTAPGKSEIIEGIENKSDMPEALPNNSITELNPNNNIKDYKEKKKDSTSDANGKNELIDSTDTKAVKEKKATVPVVGVRELLSYFAECHARHTGAPYMINYGKEGAAFKAMLPVYGPDKMKDIIKAFFQSKDEFIIRAGFTVGVMRSQINKLAASLAQQPRQSNGPTSTMEYYRSLTTGETHL